MSQLTFTHSLTNLILSTREFLSFFLSFLSFSSYSIIRDLSFLNFFLGLSRNWDTHFTHTFGSELLWNWRWIWGILCSETSFCVDSSQDTQSCRKLSNTFISTWFSFSIHLSSISSLLGNTHHWRSWCYFDHSYNTHCNLCACDSFRVGVPQIEATASLLFLWLSSFLKIRTNTSQRSSLVTTTFEKSLFGHCFLFLHSINPINFWNLSKFQVLSHMCDKYERVLKPSHHFWMFFVL